MDLQTPYKAASDALFKRMQLAFSDDGLALYGETKPPQPKVDQGTPRNIAPFHVWVDFLPYSNSAQGSATSHELATNFALDVYCIATHANRNKAVDALQMYVNSVCMAITAEATLGKAVNNAIPRISDAAVDGTSDKKHIAAAVIEVTLKTASICPKEFKELVRNAENGK